MAFASSCQQTDEASRLKTLERDCANDRNYQLVSRRIDICDRSDAVFATKVSCFSQFERAFSYVQGQCKELASFKIRQVEKKYILDSIENLQVDTVTQLIHEELLANFFQLFDLWSSTSKEIINFAAAEAFQIDSEDFLSHFWQKVSNEKIEGRIADLFSQNLKLLQAVNKQKRPDSKITLQVVNQILSALDEKIQNLTELSDLVCTISNCRSTKPKVYNLLKALGNVHDGSAPQTGMSELESEIVRAIANALQLHANSFAQTLVDSSDFEDFESALNSDSLIDLIDIDTDLQRLISKLRYYRQLSARFDQYGSFSDQESIVIDSGLDLQVVSEMVNMVDKFSKDLSTESNYYQDSKIRLINALKSSIADSSQRVNLSYRLDQKIADLEFNFSELEALRSAVNKQEVDNSKYIEELADLRNSEKIEFFNRKKISDQNELFTVSASDALFEIDSKPDYKSTDYSLMTTIDLQKGDIINFQSLGSWSPRCAISRGPYAASAPSGVEIGPSGYYVQTSQNRSSIVSNSITRSRGTARNIGSQDSSCIKSAVGGQISFGALLEKTFKGALQTGGSANLGLNISQTSEQSACITSSLTISNSTQKSNSETQSNSLSETAANQQGIKSNDTPFPDFPAGSLLVFALPQGSNSYEESLETRTMDVGTSLLAKEDTTIHFVVNDCLDRGMEPGPSLTIRYEILNSAKADVTNMLNALIDAVEYMAEQGQDFVKEGGNIGTKIQALKNDAIARYTRENNSRLSFYEIDALQATFNAWLDYEAVKLQRKIEIKNLEKIIQDLLLEISSLYELLSNEEKNELYNAEIISTISSNLSHSVVYTEMHRLIRVLVDRLYPMIKVHYPKAIAQLQLERNAILNLDIESDITAVSRSVSRLTDSLVKVLNVEEISKQINKEDRVVLLRFADPTVLKPSDTYAPFANEVYSASLFSTLLDFGSANDVQIPGVKKGKPVTVSPSDLYKPAELFSRKLFCRESLPIMSDFRIFLVFDSNMIGTESFPQLGGYQLEMTLGQEMILPTPTGAANLYLSNPNSGTVTVPIEVVTNMDLNQIEGKMLSTPNRQIARGLSPFTSYSFAGNIDGLKRKLVEDFSAKDDPSIVKEIVFAYRLSTDDAAGVTAQNWITSCNGVSN